jgi:hypothetical protein
MVLLAASTCVIFSPASADAAVIKFSGQADGRSVSGFIKYDESTLPFDTVDDPETAIRYYFPGVFSFKSDGLNRSNDPFLAVVGDAVAGNSSGIPDVFNAFVVNGGSAIEQYGFFVDYGSATALASASLPPFLPQGPATFSYEFAGEGFTIPVTFSSSVPEPSTWAMMILGIAGAGGLIRRRSRKDVITVSAAC